LATEAFFTSSAGELKLTDTGDIHRDLLNQVTRFVKMMVDTPAGPALRGIIAAAQSDETVRQAFVEHYVSPRSQHGGAALRRAQQRGQITPDVNVRIVIDQIWGACYYRLMTTPEEVDERYVRVLLEQTLGGVAVFA